MARFNTRRAPLERPDGPFTRADLHAGLRAMEIRLSGLIIALAGIAVAIVKLT